MERKERTQARILLCPTAFRIDTSIGWIFLPDLRGVWHWHNGSRTPHALRALHIPGAEERGNQQQLRSDLEPPTRIFPLGISNPFLLSSFFGMPGILPSPWRQVGGIGTVSERILKDVLSVTKCGDFLTHRAEVMALFSPISCGEGGMDGGRGSE